MASPVTLLADSGSSGGGNFLVPNATFIFEVIAFLIILFVLRKYVLPPLSKAMNARQATIKQQLDDAEAAKDSLANAQAEYQRALAEARAEGTKIREDARAEALAIREELVAKAHEDSDRVIAAGREQLQAERASLVRELRAEMGTLAVELASKIVGESLVDEARQKGTVDRFLADLGSK